MKILETLSHSPLVLSFIFLLLALFFSSVCYAISPAIIRLQITPFLFLLGMILLPIGFYIRYAGLKELLKVNKNISHYSIPESLVTSGIYEQSRNPAYFGFILMLVALLLIYPSLAMVIIIVIFLVSLNSYAKKEEQILSKKFGRTYTKYKKRVPRWI